MLCQGLRARSAPLLAFSPRTSWGSPCAGMLEAESRFRKVEGYRGLAGLAVKIEHDLLRNRQPDTHTSTQESTTAATV